MLLSFSGSLAKTFTSLNCEKCLGRSTLCDLNPNELYYYLLMISLDRWNGNCNILDETSGRIYAPHKTEYVNLNVFNTITRIN